MYHCKLSFKFIGRECPMFSVIRAAAPMKHFAHSFDEAAPNVFVYNSIPEDGLCPIDKDAKLILMADWAQAEAYINTTPEDTELWPRDLSEEEAEFRFKKWQQKLSDEAALWMSRQALNTTINSVPNLVWFKDKNGIHEKVNDAFCEVVRKKKSDVEGRDHCYIWDATEEEAKVCAETDRKVMEMGRTVIAEEEVASASGKRILTTYKSPIVDMDGSVMGTVGIGIDITEERMYQSDAVHKANILDTLFNSLDCGLIIHSLDGREVYSVNDAALAILDYDNAEQMIADGFSTVAQSVIDEDKHIVLDAVKAINEVGDSVEVEYRVQHRNGEIITVLGKVKMVIKDGKRYIQRFLLNVTERKAREHELERHNSELIKALGADYNFIAFFDLEHDKGALLRTTGFTGDIIDNAEEFRLDFMRERYLQHVHPDDRESLEKLLNTRELLDRLEKENIIYHMFRLCIDGKDVYSEMKIVRGGRWDVVRGIVLGIRDVDEETRKQAEQRRTLEDALMQANRASRAKSNFLFNISHDIRTPMNAIVGYTALAAAHIDDKERVKDYLDKITASSDHMISLINDVLDMASIEGNKLEIEEESGAISGLLGEVGNIVAPEMQRRGHHFSIDTSAVKNDVIMCDGLRLKQLILNILSNSIKFTPNGGDIKLRVRQTMDKAPQGCGRFAFVIEDNGIGISPEFLARIYEPFEREKNATISGTQGTGLGLAIVKSIVDMMHGSISIDSTVGKGTVVTMTFTFRICKDAPSGEAADAETAPIPHTAAAEEHRRLLIVEDNELNREIAQAILEDAGYIVETAENGAIAVDMISRAEKGYYQIVLMDIQMPVMDGYEATRAIRKLPDGKNELPILALSANAYEEDMRNSIEAGMNAHIAKPIDVEKLLNSLEEY